MRDPAPIAALYTHPPEKFTGERDRLAAELRRAGRLQDATEVKSLRRPSLAAWALNLLAQRDPDALEALFRSADAVRAAQRRAMSGLPADLVTAGRKHRALVASTTDRAIALTDGRAAGQRDGIFGTLSAAALDPHVVELLRSGRLTRELPPAAGLGLAPALAAVPDLAEEPEAPETTRESGRRQPRVHERAAARTTHAHDAAKDRADAKSARERARADEERARAEAERQARADAERAAHEAAQRVETLSARTKLERTRADGLAADEERLEKELAEARGRAADADAKAAALESDLADAEQARRRADAALKRLRKPTKRR